VFANPFKDDLIWHLFDTGLTDDELDKLLNPLDVHVVMVDREKGIVWVDKDNSYTPAIQKVLNSRTVGN
jgi:hypothetical protein